MIGWIDSTTVLAGNAAFTGIARNIQNGGPYNYIKAISFSDQTGTLTIQQSLDGGTTWHIIASQAATANTAAVVSAPLTSGQVRVVYTNGATLQTVFNLSSSMVDA